MTTHQTRRTDGRRRPPFADDGVALPAAAESSQIGTPAELITSDDEARSAVTGSAQRRPPHGCGGCSREWFGEREAHCKQCHEHFGSDSAFDRHLDREYDRTPAVRCIPVEDFARPFGRKGAPRLVQVARATGQVWVSARRTL